MKRLSQFYANTGFSGTARTLIGLSAAAYLLSATIASGKGFYPAVVAGVGIALSYLLVEFLTDHITATTWVMNSVLFAFVVGLSIVPGFRNLEAVRLYTGPVAFIYVGCYFWIYSHPLVFSAERLAQLQPALDEIETAMAEIDAAVDSATADDEGPDDEADEAMSEEEPDDDDMPDEEADRTASPPWPPRRS